MLKSAKLGSIVPVYTKIKTDISPVDYFAKISDYGRKSNSFLLESAEILPVYGERSFGSAAPCLRLCGYKKDFSIEALSESGEDFLKFLKNKLDFCDRIKYSKEKIEGELKPERRAGSEEERLKLKTHADIIRAVAFAFSPAKSPVPQYAGLFGMISYDFIDQFEDLPEYKEDILKDYDYDMYFADNLFYFDHKNSELYLISNMLIAHDGIGSIRKRCEKNIEKYKKAISFDVKPRKFEKQSGKIISDTSQQEYEDIVRKMKGHIENGDVFQAVPSRTIIADYNCEELDIYKTLREINPSPYMYFFNTGDFLIGASPEKYISVSDGIVEIKPIAGTKPRGTVDGKIDADLDSRYETELKTDFKELAEHTMLVDLARNDVARISEPGTRYVLNPYVAEKYSHVQHMVSTVRGKLKKDLDPLHAYLASMNMGTLTGAPKVEAMKLLRRYEKTRRGFYGGSVCYITPSGDMDSAIVIRTMRLKGKKAYIRVGAGIVYDSVPEKEYEETERKAASCIHALELAGGISYEK